MNEVPLGVWVAVASIVAASVSSIFTGGLFMGIWKKTLNGSVEATHRIERKFDHHLEVQQIEEKKLQSRLGNIEGALNLLIKAKGD